MSPQELAELADEIQKMVAAEVELRLTPLLHRIATQEIELKRLAKEPRVVFSPNIHVPQQEAPVVKVENIIAAPNVYPTPVEVKVAASEIKFEPRIEIQPAPPTPVQVDVAAPAITMPERPTSEKKVTFSRNLKGEITTAYIN